MSTIDYSIAGAWADHVHALAMVETGGNPDAPDGDGGRAKGLLQIHPADFVQYCGRCKLFPLLVGYDWTQAQIICCASYLEIEVPQFEELSPRNGLDLAIQGWNKGVAAIRSGIRNQTYLDKWTDFFQKIRSATKAA
jgi:hypothetical protein